MNPQTSSADRRPYDTEISTEPMPTSSRRPLTGGRSRGSSHGRGAAIQPEAPAGAPPASSSASDLARTARPHGPEGRLKRAPVGGQPAALSSPRACEYCGKSIEHRAASARTCGAACKQALHRRRQKPDTGAPANRSRRIANLIQFQTRRAEDDVRRNLFGALDIDAPMIQGRWSEPELDEKPRDDQGLPMRRHRDDRYESAPPRGTRDGYDEMLTELDETRTLKSQGKIKRIKLLQYVLEGDVEHRYERESMKAYEQLAGRGDSRRRSPATGAAQPSSSP